jgi:hypothetical protein
VLLPWALLALSGEIEKKKLSVLLPWENLFDLIESVFFSKNQEQKW